MIRKHKFKPVLFLVTVVLGAVILRMAMDAREEFRIAQKLEEEKNQHEAIVHYERTIHAYFPMNQYLTPAIEHLWSIGLQAEMHDPSLALSAYDAIRGGIYSTRSLYVPHEGWLFRANQKIAHLRAQEQSRRLGTSYEDAFRFHADALQKPVSPPQHWVLVTIIGFLSWICATVGFIRHGFDQEARMFWRPAFPWIGASALGLAIWLTGLANA